MRLFFQSCLLGLISSFACAQASPTTDSKPVIPAREPAAIALAEQTLLALGGQGAISQIQDCLAQGTIQRPLDPKAPSASFTWKNSGNEFRYEEDGRPTLVTGHGKPAKVKGGKLTHLLGSATISDFPAHLAAVQLLRRLRNPRFGFAALPDSQADGHAVSRIKTWSSGPDLVQQLTTQIWFIDKSSDLPLRVEYVEPDSHYPRLQGHFAVEFSDWRTVSGVMVPFRIVKYFDVLKAYDTTLSTVSFNSGVAAADFDGGVQ